MNDLPRLGVAFSACACIMSFAAAAGPVGVWHGHVTVDFSKLPPVEDPVRKKAMMERIKEATQVKVTLTLNRDKSFLLIATGGVGVKPPETGTYTFTPTTVTIHPTTKGGRNTPQTLLLSRDGKTLFLSQGPASVTFVK